MHLSRLSEDLITWNTHEFGFVELSDAFSTGSSLMPQKKNPDMAELTRGKTGRLYGNLLSILTTLKALRSSYNRDMQEDKEALFDSVDTVRAALEVFSAMLAKIEINRGRMKAAASDPNLLATDLAEYLVKKGTPFREAHEIVGKLVAHGAKAKLPLNQIPIAELKKFRHCLMSMLRTCSTFAVHLQRGCNRCSRAGKHRRPDRALGKIALREAGRNTDAVCR